eukprot:1151932-Pelagomonas_calceolata.AAC.3
MLRIAFQKKPLQKLTLLFPSLPESALCMLYILQNLDSSRACVEGCKHLLRLPGKEQVEECRYPLVLQKLGTQEKLARNQAMCNLQRLRPVKPFNGNKDMVFRFIKKDLWASIKITYGFVFKSFQKSLDAARELFFSEDLPKEELERCSVAIAVETSLDDRLPWPHLNGTSLCSTAAKHVMCVRHNNGLTKFRLLAGTILYGKVESFMIR